MLIIWLAPIAMYVSRPVMMLSRKDWKAGTRSIFPMNTKCAEQCVVHVKQSFSRYKQEQYKNDRKQDADVQKFGDIQQAQHKCDAVKDNLFFRKFNRMVVPIDYDRVLFDKEHGDQDSKQRCNRVREHNLHECTEGHAGFRI